jgi:hypothetical protein
MREYLKNLQAFQQGTAAKGAKTIADIKRARDLADVRGKYGNANVDYVLKNGEAALAPDTEFAAAVTGKH